jgi:4-hydroxybenzoate polyprenyltransferase
MAAEPQALKTTDAVARSWVESVSPALQPYLRLMRLDRPIGTWLLFWPGVFGLVMGAAAQGRPFDSWNDVWFVALFGIGAIIMRGAGCTFNDIVDRDIDAKVARTRARPVASGVISVKRAVIFLAAQCLIGLVVLLQFNLFAIELGAASLVLVAIYPFMKRVTWWPQAWLGLTFNWGALLGFAAQTGRVDAADMLLYAGCFFWTLGYDTIYAHQDVEDDALIGVKSTARLFGKDSPRWILLFYAAAFALISTAGLSEHLGPWFLLFMFAPILHFFWQVRALRIENAQNCLEVFRSNRDAGGLVAVALFVATFLQ